MFEKSVFDRELQTLDALAPMGYFLGLHIRFTAPLMTLQTYDQAWMDHYTENGYVLRDPMTAWGFSATGSTRWSSENVPDPFGIFQQAAKFGLRYGATISCGPISSRTIASVGRADREFFDAEIEQIEALVHRLHDMTEPPQELTKAQIEALKCIADGMRLRPQNSEFRKVHSRHGCRQLDCGSCHAPLPKPFSAQRTTGCSERHTPSARF
jgi:LuxR family transcriptional regulator